MATIGHFDFRRRKSIGYNRGLPLWIINGNVKYDFFMGIGHMYLIAWARDDIGTETSVAIKSSK